MGNVFAEITLIICLAALFAIFFRFLKQPPILGYILTGILLGPLGFFHLNGQEVLKSMAEIGITLLLFILGLELRLSELKIIGKAAFIIGCAQVLLTGFFGFMLSLALGFDTLNAFYLSIALTFSSTIIIIKLLSDKKDLNSLYGKILIGVLLVQDFFAILFLILLSSFTQATQNPLALSNLSLLFIKSVILFGSVIYLSKSIFPLILDEIAVSQETLFLFSLAWVFGLSAFVSSHFIGFSIEIGGFLAGIALANASENFQIVARVRALRDFFVTIFFVTLGMQMVFRNITDILLPIVILSFFVLVGKPLLVAGIMGTLGYRKRTAFLSGVHLAQISEFSLVTIFLGSKLGHVSNDVVSLVTAVGLITFITSTYTISHANSVYRFFSKHLGILEGSHTRSENMGASSEMLEDLKDHVILVGAHRMGQSVVDAFKHSDDKLVVVDFDPDIVKGLKEGGTLSVFGDIADPDIQERVRLSKARLVVSTVSDVEDNIALVRGLRYARNGAKIVVMAQDAHDARTLYKAGADYVVLPHFVGGKHLAKVIKENNLENIDELKEKDLATLTKQQLG